MLKLKYLWLKLTRSLRAVCVALLTSVYGSLAFAASAADSKSIGGVANTVIKSFGSLAKLITAGAFIAGMGFMIGAVLKFKAYKDNPTQIPVGTPIALLFIAAALIFLPQIFTTVGHTLFGTSFTPGTVSGTETVQT